MSVAKIASQPTLHNLDQTYKTAEKEHIETSTVQENQFTQNEADLEKVVKSMNDFLQPANTHIKFELHEELNEYYVTVVDNQTNEVVREIPSKKLLDIYSKMTEFMGLLFDKKI